MKIGSTAPDFSLYDDHKNLVTLSELRGEAVLLLFFPLAFTNVCTAELCSVRDQIGLYNDLNTRVFGISVDSLHSLRKFREEQSLNFPLLSDFNKQVSELYNCIYPEFGYGMKGVPKRAAFIIDQNGLIRYAEVLENADLQPDFKAIQETLKLLAE